MRGRNLASSLRQRPQPEPTRTFDTLPPDLRRWLSDACLPQSARSVRSLWTRALADAQGDAAAARARLDAAEARCLRRDADRIWGSGYPHPR